MQLGPERRSPLPRPRSPTAWCGQRHCSACPPRLLLRHLSAPLSSPGQAAASAAKQTIKSPKRQSLGLCSWWARLKQDPQAGGHQQSQLVIAVYASGEGAVSAGFSTNLLCDLGQVPSTLWNLVCCFVQQEVLQVSPADGCCVAWLREPVVPWLCIWPRLASLPACSGPCPSLPSSHPASQAPWHQLGAEHWPHARASAIRLGSGGGSYIWGPFLGLKGVLWVSFPARCPC